MRSDTSKDVLNSLGIGVHPRFDSRIVHQDMADALSGFVRDKTLNIDEVRLGKFRTGDFLQYLLQSVIACLMILVKIHHFDAVIGIVLQCIKLPLSIHKGIPHAAFDAFCIEICLPLPL